MPLYSNTIPVPMNTVEDNPVELPFVVNEPVITNMEIYFPPGCAGLCYVAIFINGLQFAPASGSADRYHHGEGSITWFGREKLPKGTSQNQVVIRAYNLDDTYDHHPIIRMGTDFE